MVAEISSKAAATPAPRNPSRAKPPLLPSDPSNAAALRRPKAREVTSRYMSSSSTSNRCPSPLIPQSAGHITPMPGPPSTIKRSQSVERRRPSTPRPGSFDLRNGACNGGPEVSTAHRMLVTSTRSLSVSFQGESFSLQVSKTKPVPSPIGVRKLTPERRRPGPTPVRVMDQGDVTRHVEQHRWPGRLRPPNSVTRSVDCMNNRKQLNGSSRTNLGTSGVVLSSIVDNCSSSESTLSSDSSMIDSQKPVDLNGLDQQSDLPIASDTDSASSGSNCEGNGNSSCGGGQTTKGQRGIMVPARFWHETNNRMCHPQESSPPVSKSFGLIGTIPPKLVPPKLFASDAPQTVSSRAQSSPLRGTGLRPASPNKLRTPMVSLSPTRGVSPSRIRNGAGVVQNNSFGSTPSILSFLADFRRGKIGENRIVDVHSLRLLYNRLLQWRFVNARADTAQSAQNLNAEKSLHAACVATSKLRESVAAKRTELQSLKQNLKLVSILKGQMSYLEEISQLNPDYARSLSGAIEALRASTLKLPVVGGARADIKELKDAISSAVDVMQAMSSSICVLLSKVGGVNTLVGELANTTTKELALLDQSKHLLSTLAATQIKESSLQTHTLQLKKLHSSPTSEV